MLDIIDLSHKTVIRVHVKRKFWRFYDSTGDYKTRVKCIFGLILGKKV